MKNTKKIILGMFALLFSIALFGFGKVDAKAYDITQTGQTQNTVNIQWTPEKYMASSYYLGVSTDMNEAKALAQSRTKAIASNVYGGTLINLQPGNAYYVYLVYDYKYSSSSKVYTTYKSGYVKTLPGVVTGLNQQEWYRLALSVNIGWDKQPGVDGYEYRFMDHYGNDIDHNFQRTTSISEKVKNSKVYTGTVRAYSDINGVRYFSDWCPTAYFMTQPAKKAGRYGAYRELDAKVSGGKIKIGWEKVDGLDGYNVYVATSRGGSFKKVKSVGRNKKSVNIKKVRGKKIKNNKTYYVYVEGYKNVNGNRYTTGLNYITQVKRNSTSVIYVSSWR